MAAPPENKLDSLGIVNSSGFPLQIAVGHYVRTEGSDSGFEVLFSEHAWQNPRTGDTGFIDLVLRKGPIFLVVECKRPKDTKWIFFRDDPKKADRRHAKCWVSTPKKVFDWRDVAMSPTSFQAAFCTTRGSNGNDVPMLERIAGPLIEATEALAVETEGARGKEFGTRFFFNVIVTTAPLEKCLFDPAEISLTTGKIANADCASIPYVRFRKHLSARAGKAKDLRGLVSAKENTVFVVNAAFLGNFLDGFEIDQESIDKYS